MKLTSGIANYKLGAVYSLATAVLLAIQEPFSALAARKLTSSEFICLTQIALLLSVPLLTPARPVGVISPPCFSTSKIGENSPLCLQSE